MATKCQIIVNRAKAAFNRKHRNLPEEPTLSIHTGSKIEYAFAVELTGTWILKQDYEHSPCSGAHIWLEGDRENLEITHTRPLLESEDIPLGEKESEDVVKPFEQELF